jgi:hypothetical protein
MAATTIEIVDTFHIEAIGYVVFVKGVPEHEDLTEGGTRVKSYYELPEGALTVVQDGFCWNVRKVEKAREGCLGGVSSWDWGLAIDPAPGGEIVPSKGEVNLITHRRVEG